MAESPSTEEGAIERRRIYAQLLHQQRRALERLITLRDELAAPVTQSFLESLRSGASDSVPEGVTDVLAKIEDALRAIEFCQSEIHRELAAPRTAGESGTVSGESGEAVRLEDLPAALVRFLDERKSNPGFSYELRRDSERGWIIRWKEHTSGGIVRGSGQFYERPYAWLHG